MQLFVLTMGHICVSPMRHTPRCCLYYLSLELELFVLSVFIDSSFMWILSALSNTASPCNLGYGKTTYHIYTFLIFEALLAIYIDNLYIFWGLFRTWIIIPRWWLYMMAILLQQSLTIAKTFWVGGVLYVDNIGVDIHYFKCK